MRVVCKEKSGTLFFKSKLLVLNTKLNYGTILINQYCNDFNAIIPRCEIVTLINRHNCFKLLITSLGSLEFPEYHRYYVC